MRFIPAAVAVFATVSLAACASLDIPNPFQRGEQPTPVEQPPAALMQQPAAALAPDIHSYAQPEIARVLHVALDLKVDFERKVLSGRATLDVQAAPGAGQLVLDSKGLVIKRISAGGRDLTWTLGAADPILGQALTITLPDNARRIAIDYESAPGAGALQWLTPEQTAGKVHPYLFSQGQSILTRSWVPTQDSPGIRQTWEARITAPEALRAVMSAEDLTPAGEAAGPGLKAWRFNMDKAVPPYLIALAVGDIAFKPLGPRTGVYAEPSILDAAASELRDTEKMVEAAEKLYGPYRWGRYDVLILPPSFPFGGMENPRLTFATPTILAGDRSLVSLIAHELAHSWSGNLVTNATWADFWVNEGFTTYFENRIMEEVYDRLQAEVLQTLGWADWMSDIAENGGLRGPDTRLKVDLAGRDPDDGSTDIPYEKGAAFLRMVERTVGREKFDAWLRAYFDRYAFQPMTTEIMLADMRANLIKGDAALEAKLQLDTWIYQPGVPSNAVEPETTLFVTVDAMAGKFANGLTTARGIYVDGWSTQEWQRFLTALPRKLTRAQMDELEGHFHFNEAGNSEIRFLWLRLAIANRYDPALPSLEQFLTSQGRRKFVVPLFTDLMAQGDWGRPVAQRIYAKARPGYHPVTASSADEVVLK